VPRSPSRKTRAKPKTGKRAAAINASRSHNGEKFGDRLRRLRAERELSQRDLAEKCDGVSYAYISRLEAGERTASVRAIRELAAALGVSSASLEYGHDGNRETGPLQRLIEQLQQELERERLRADEAETQRDEYAAQLARLGG
jgi:transcriptional regulator with XRE-family HTH domain